MTLSKEQQDYIIWSPANIETGDDRNTLHALLEDGNSCIVGNTIYGYSNSKHNCGVYPMFEKLEEDPNDGRLRVRLVNYTLIPNEFLTDERHKLIKLWVEEARLTKDVEEVIK